MNEDKDTRGGAQTLLSQHAELIRASAIAEEVAAARGYRSLTVKADARRLGFGISQVNVPALLVPIRSVFGEIGTYQLRPDQPRIRNGRPIKYETPAGSRMMLDVPPAVRAKLGDPAVPLVVTEGARKADSAVSSGLAAVALLGVWNWRGRNEMGGSLALPDWESVALRGRMVFLAFDSDVMVKPAVGLALRRLGAFLESRGAEVRPIYLPPMPDGAKQGIDDFLGAGGSASSLLELAEDRFRAMPGAAGGSERFVVTDGRICEVRGSAHGVEVAHVPLCNFTAEIVEEVVADDGASERAELILAGSLASGAPLPTIRVPRNRFSAMRWPFESWGVGAIVEPGMGNADKLRAAIQSISQGVHQRRVYEHTGWRKVDDGWVFLHAGGAIGPGGPVDGIDVELPASASLVRLPEPPSGMGLQEAVRASLGLLDLAPDAVMAPLLGAVFRAPLLSAMPADLGMFIVGPTGSFKSELASLLMRHAGAGFDRLHLPLSWSATANYIERTLFDYKDLPVVIDDFAPGTSARDADRLHATAERVFRGVGNASARGRLSADAVARPVYPARGLAIATGEDEPRGHSIRARLVLVEVEPGDIDRSLLTRCQEQAAAGLLAAAFSGYLGWMAADFPQLPHRLSGRFAELRTQACHGPGHARTPDAIANLALGWETLLLFAANAGAVSGAEAGEVWQRAWAGLLAAGERQASHQVDQEPTARFRVLLASALAAGAGHVAGPDGDFPAVPERWGWRKTTAGAGDLDRTEWRPQGARVGWVDGDRLCLDLETALALVNRLGSSTGGGVPLASKTLAKRLDQRGLLAATEGGERGGLSVRRNLEGARRRVHEVRADFLVDEESGQSGQPGPARRQAPAASVPTPDFGRMAGTDSMGAAAPSHEEPGDRDSVPMPGDREGRIGRIPLDLGAGDVREVLTW